MIRGVRAWDGGSGTGSLERMDSPAIRVPEWDAGSRVKSETRGREVNGFAVSPLFKVKPKDSCVSVIGKRSTCQNSE